MKYLILLFVLPMVTSINAQHLEGFKWNQRVLLVISEDHTSELLQEQLDELQQQSEGMKERKLVVCILHPDKYGILNDDAILWVDYAELYNMYNPDNIAFKTELIGLDGGTKLQTTELLTTEKLFAILDGMPMRQRELKKN